MDGDDLPGAESAVYEPPKIARLGTLAELTRGAAAGPDDGFGGGDVGDIAAY